MINNDVLRSIRYALDISDPKTVEIIKLGGQDIDRPVLAGLLKKEDEEGYTECGDIIMRAFLNGLITYKRGKSGAKPDQGKNPDAPLHNNDILKKLRIAFELKEDDLHEIMELAEFSISRPELSALFRKEGHKNYRKCGDQVLRNFLKGLTLRLRGAFPQH